MQSGEVQGPCTKLRPIFANFNVDCSNLLCGVMAALGIFIHCQATIREDILSTAMEGRRE
jgi:hypothetical protein